MTDKEYEEFTIRLEQELFEALVDQVPLVEV